MDVAAHRHRRWRGCGRRLGHIRPVVTAGPIRISGVADWVNERALKDDKWYGSVERKCDRWVMEGGASEHLCSSHQLYAASHLILTYSPIAQATNHRTIEQKALLQVYTSTK